MTEKCIYVVCDYDFPSAAFDHKPRAETFVARHNETAARFQTTGDGPKRWHLQEIPYNEGDGEDK